MILADTSVWADHFRKGEVELVAEIRRCNILIHPFVIAELALGHLRQRSSTLRDLKAMPRSVVATDEEILALIETEQLIAAGIGLIDVHLLASAMLSAGSTLWTRDRRLGAIAARVGVAFEPGQ